MNNKTPELVVPRLYSSTTVPPAASRAALSFSASSLDTFARISWGRDSTSFLAWLKVRERKKDWTQAICSTDLVEKKYCTFCSSSCSSQDLEYKETNNIKTLQIILNEEHQIKTIHQKLVKLRGAHVYLNMRQPSALKLT